MSEFEDLINFCYAKYISTNCDRCDINEYCVNHNCNKGDCQKCLYHILHDSPNTFHYSCNKITYLYVIRFFYRFASEIRRFFEKLNAKDLNVVSLGCGPASELFGIVDGVRAKNPSGGHINYFGFDTNKIWKELHDYTIKVFADRADCNVIFRNEDLFNSICLDNITNIDVLIFNYLLSDYIKQEINQDNVRSFLRKISDFVVTKKIKVILCNDISFYGYPFKTLDSSIKCMKMIETLISQDPSVEKVVSKGICYPSDSYKPYGWHQWDDEKIKYNVNDLLRQYGIWETCASKYIILKIDYIQ